MLTCLLMLCPFGSTACGQSIHSPEGAAREGLLNSERIRQRYGSYGIEVLQQDDRIRVSNLYSGEGEAKTTRTVAVVIYSPSIPGPIETEHREIAAGGSIGEVFTSHGWRVEKQTLFIGELPASADFAGLYNSMGGIEPQALAIHIYALSVSRGGENVSYATLAEVHHPDYLGRGELESIYASAPGARTAERDTVESSLELATGIMAAW